MATRGQSIGAVLRDLREDFPDLTISKIRFLEDQGLIAPTRTPAGYRMFAAADVDRLRFVLTAQRDRFWPLKVVKDALEAMDRGLTIDSGSSPSGLPSAPAEAVGAATPSPAQLRAAPTLRLTAAELGEAASLGEAEIEALATFGLLHPDATGHFDSDALAVAKAAGALAGYGVEPRHLRAFRTAAEREIGLVQQIVGPARAAASRRAADGRSDLTDPTADVLAQCVALHTALVRAQLHAR